MNDFEVVVSNSEADVRKRRLTDRLNRSFAMMAANLLKYLCGRESLDRALDEEFQEARRAYVAEIGYEPFVDRDGTPSEGIPIEVFDFGERPSGEPDPDGATNTVIRGALGMVAALLVDPKSGMERRPDYARALDEFARGIAKVNAKLDSENPHKNPHIAKRKPRR